MTIQTPHGPAMYKLDSHGALTHFFIGQSDGIFDTGGGPVGRQVKEYFDGTRTVFDLPLAPEGSSFQKRVWAELLNIPYGGTITYSELADRLGVPGAARAVGRANSTNPIWLIVPCHRVIGARGALTGYAGGIELKKSLLEWEREVANREFSLKAPE